MGISDRISAEIGNPPKDLVLSYCNADLAILKPRLFVEGVNQFDSYHFVIPKIEVSTFFADKKEVSIRKNLVLPTNPGQELKFSPVNSIYKDSDDIKFICMFIDTCKFQQLTKEVFNKSSLFFYNDTANVSSSTLTLISRFESEFSSKQFGYQFILDSLAMEITVNLIRELKSNMPDLLGLRNYSARKEINKAIDFLWENNNLEFSLDMLCGIVNLSHYYFIRLFKEHTGKTPYEYYMDIKINKSLTYLKSKRYSITDICYLLGFSSQSHFSSVFKRKIGVTPSEFIKSLS